MTMTRRRFTHDCRKCVYLGHFSGHDLYHCVTSAFVEGSVIARYGDGAGDYASGPVRILRRHLDAYPEPLRVAVYRADAAGITQAA